MLVSGLETAKKWHYIAEIPHTTPPAEKTVKRKAWEAGRVYEVLESVKEDRKNLEGAFRDHLVRIGIPAGERVDIQGLRKSGQMHKVRLSKNDYQLVAESAGQSPEVLMSNYNEALDSEKRALSRMVEGSFYPKQDPETESEHSELSDLLAKVQGNPELQRQLLQKLLLDAVGA